MAKAWTLEKIRAKTRKYSGRLSTNDLSNADLDEYINEFYQNALPGILGVHEFEAFSTLTLGIDDGDYVIDTDITDGEDIHVIEQPFTVNGIPVNFHTDPEAFQEIWPNDGEPYDSGEVQDVLLLGRTLTFRPPPDSADVARFLVKRKSPAALIEADDMPLDARWGNLIAAGAAKKIKEDAEEDTSSVVLIIQEEKLLFTREKNQMMQKTRTSKREL